MVYVNVMQLKMLHTYNHEFLITFPLFIFPLFSSVFFQLSEQKKMPRPVLSERNMWA